MNSPPAHTHTQRYTLPYPLKGNQSGIIDGEYEPWKKDPTVKRLNRFGEHHRQSRKKIS